MPPTEIILTLLVWLAAGAAFLHYRRRAGADSAVATRAGKVKKQ